jgi:hypothetical protein
MEFLSLGIIAIDILLLSSDDTEFGAQLRADIPGFVAGHEWVCPQIPYSGL